MIEDMQNNHEHNDEHRTKTKRRALLVKTTSSSNEYHLEFMACVPGAEPQGMPSTLWLQSQNQQGLHLLSICALRLFQATRHAQWALSTTLYNLVLRGTPLRL